METDKPSTSQHSGVNAEISFFATGNNSLEPEPIASNESSERASIFSSNSEHFSRALEWSKSSESIDSPPRSPTPPTPTPQKKQINKSNDGNTTPDENISIDNGVPEDQPSIDSTPSDINAKILLYETVNHSIEPQPNGLNRSSVLATTFSSDSEHNMALSKSSKSAELLTPPAPIPHREHQITSFHGVTGQIETVGTSISIGMQGEIVEYISVVK